MNPNKQDKQDKQDKQILPAEDNPLAADGFLAALKQRGRGSMRLNQLPGDSK